MRLNEAKEILAKAAFQGVIIRDYAKWKRALIIAMEALERLKENRGAVHVVDTSPLPSETT